MDLCPLRHQGREWEAEISGRKRAFWDHVISRPTEESSRRSLPRLSLLCRSRGCLGSFCLLSGSLLAQ